MPSLARAATVFSALLVASGALAALSEASAGPTAGDLDEARVDAGPAPQPAPDGTQAALEDTAPAADAAPAEPLDVAPAPSPAAPATPDDSAAAASPDPTVPAVAADAPLPDATAPAVDPLGEPAPPAPVPTSAPDKAIGRTGPGFGGVPALNYDSDNGFGFGLIGTFYWYDGATDPYRLAVTLQIFITSKLVQDHNIQVDWLRAFDLPLRLNSRIGYVQSLTQNYCGLGGDVSCDPDVARAAGKDRGLEGEALETFARNYYQRRFINPYGLVNARLMLHEAPKPQHLRVELLGGYRGFYFVPGHWFDDDGDGSPDFEPYAGSLYAQDFPDGEPGFSSVLQAGIILDTRNNEPAPTEGMFLEATVRGSSPVWGSSWNWAGANVTLRGYAPLMPDGKLVLATRLVGDAIIGDPPIQELARVGGSVDYYAFGGADMGRGIRVQRFLGKLRILNQTELRWRFLDFTVFEQQFGLMAAGLVDTGIVGAELAEPGPMPVNVGVGAGLRLSWNENFVIRFDVAASPAEDFRPGIYIVVNNPF